MKSLFRYIIVLSLLLYSVFSVSGATVRTTRINSADGLSNSAVSVVMKDSSGRLWIGTWDGLNLFNGRDITVFKPDKKNPHSLPSNIISDIIEQRRDIIWVATHNGVARMDMANGGIRRFFDEGDRYDFNMTGTFRLALAPGGYVCCLVRNHELAWYDEGGDTFRNLSTPGIDSGMISSIVSHVGRVHIVTKDGGVYRLGFSEGGGFPEIVSCERVDVGMPVSYIFRGDGGSLWLVGADDICRLDCETGSVVKAASIGNNFPPSSVTTCTEVDGNLFVGSTTKGFFSFEPVARSFTQFDNPDFQCGVLCSYYDEGQEILWIGTNGNGLFSVYEDNLHFSFMPTDRIFPESRSLGVIRSICEDSRGRLWIGSRGGGVSVVSGVGSKEVRAGSVAGLEDESILSMVNSGGGRLIIGSEYGNLYCCEAGGLEVRPVDLSGVTCNGLPFDDAIYGLCWDETSSSLWMGTNMSGVFRLKLDFTNGCARVSSSENFSKNNGALKDNSVYSLFMLDTTRVCVATRGGGINIIDPLKGQTQVIGEDSPEPLSDNDILYVIRSADGSVWAGTSFGLNHIRMSGEGYEISRYTTDNGLRNNTIHGIVEDADGVVWVSTNSGISKIDPSEGLITNYSQNEWLAGNEFADGAFCKSSRGYVIFGGNRGINYFVPDELEERLFVPELTVAGLRVNNREVLVNDVLNVSGEIELKHNENFFEVSFVALDYINNPSCEYRYILEGFNPGWVNLETNNTAIFTNVPAGHYKLRVEATNGDKVWSGGSLEVTVVVRKAWWATNFAYVVYFLLFAGVLTIVLLYLRNRIRMQHRIRLEQVEKQQMQLAYEEKLRFFTNVSHEFKTPLSLIKIHLDALQANPSADNSAGNLAGIHRNTVRMQRLIGEFLDFRKREAGQLGLSVRQQEIAEHVREVCNSFLEYSRHKNIEFSFIPPAVDLPPVWFDGEQMLKVWYNLISNAFAYTPAGGRIEVGICRGEEEVQVYVSDSGIGISERNLRHIFDNFFQVKGANRTGQGTGVGLSLTKAIVEMHAGRIDVESTPGEGSRFTVTLREGRAHLEGRPNVEFGGAEAEKPLSFYGAEDENKADAPMLVADDAGRKPKLLVVEDDDELREMLAGIFGQYYNVIAASDGRVALEVIRNNYPDIVVSDVVMPEMSGYELCAHLKGNINTSHIPVILLTAQDSEMHNIKGLESGADDYVTKPFSTRLLLMRCRNLLLNRRLLQEKFRSGIDVPPESVASNSLDKGLMESIERVIEANLADPTFNITRLCGELAIGRSVLFYKMKSLTGYSPMDLIRNIRLKRAARMLVERPAMPVSEVSDSVGFTSIHYFDKCFKELFGTTPSKYRNDTLSNL